MIHTYIYCFLGSYIVFVWGVTYLLTKGLGAEDHLYKATYEAFLQEDYR